MNILVTGANRGIGLNFCKHFINQGHNVFAVCRNASPELQALGATIIEGIDVSDDAAIKNLAGQLEENSLDIVINNAGILRSETLENFNLEQIEQQWQVNALAPIKLSHALLGKLKKPSKLVFITSRMGSIADNTSGAKYGYRMSKAALNAAAKSLSVDLKPEGIAVGILHPGFVQTEMVGGAGDISPEDAAARLIDRINELTLETSGVFYHGNGEPLPW